ncbi:MAG TPA: helix-hairpin-helix domain-containing protein [Stellaceae bacterium]|nr:helix-hairpin-helix domain-containing protein [Stellaceae bacterium]
MRIGRYLVAAALSALLAAPVLAQTTSFSAGHPVTVVADSKSDSTARAQPKGGLVDINSASSAELDKLPGIGSARAKAIIDNRPYRAKSDLAQRKIVPQNVYDQIKDKIVARQGTPASGSTKPPSTGSKSK